MNDDKVKVVGFISPRNGRFFDKKPLEHNHPVEMGCDKEDVYTAYEFVVSDASMLEHEFESMINKMYRGHGSENDVPYILTRVPNGAIIITVDNPEFYGDEVVALWMPEELNLGSYDKEMALWCKTRRP